MHFVHGNGSADRAAIYLGPNEKARAAPAIFARPAILVASGESR
jgi:hypothetical protein